MSISRSCRCAFWPINQGAKKRNEERKERRNEKGEREEKKKKPTTAVAKGTKGPWSDLEMPDFSRYDNFALMAGGDLDNGWRKMRRIKPIDFAKKEEKGSKLLSVFFFLFFLASFRQRWHHFTQLSGS